MPNEPLSDEDLDVLHEQDLDAMVNVLRDVDEHPELSTHARLCAVDYIEQLRRRIDDLEDECNALRDGFAATPAETPAAEGSDPCAASAFLPAEPTPPAPAPKLRAAEVLPLRTLLEQARDAALRRHDDSSPDGWDRPHFSGEYSAYVAALRMSDAERARTAAIVAAARRVAQLMPTARSYTPFDDALRGLRAAVDSSAEPQNLTREEG